MNHVLATVLVGVFGITGSLIMLACALAMFRVNDALSRINVFSPATGFGMPLIVVAAWVADFDMNGFDWGSLLIAALAVICLIVVSSVASNTLSRASVLSGQPVHRKTKPNRLAVAPEGVVDVDESAEHRSGE